MNISRELTFTTIFSSLFLSACLSPKPKVDTTKALLDGDVVMLEGRGGWVGKQGTLSLMGVAPMSYEELTHCGNTVIEANQRQSQLNAANQQLSTQKADLARQETALNALRPAVDVHSKQQVDAFNERVKQNQANISQFNANVNAFNAKVHELNGLNNQFNAACAHRGYRPSDYARLSSQQRFALETKSEKTDIPLIEDAAVGGEVKP